MRCGYFWGRHTLDAPLQWCSSCLLLFWLECRIRRLILVLQSEKEKIHGGGHGNICANLLSANNGVVLGHYTAGNIAIAREINFVKKQR